MPESIPARWKSIDTLRALTMVLMIFVNDFWTLKNVPAWLKHVNAQADGLGFSDVIFPAFLFIVGLSIPLAIDKRLKKETPIQVFIHILTRGFALVLMGLFTVNLENIYADAMAVPKYVWQLLMILAFFLIWNNYSSWKNKSIDPRIFVTAGVLLLVILYFLYRGGNAEDIRPMQRYWWGILGLIGWAYFFGAWIYLSSRGKMMITAGITLLITIYHLSFFGGYLNTEGLNWLNLFLTGHGAHQLLVMGGILLTMVLKEQKPDDFRRVLAILLICGFILLCFGFLLRPGFGGISKIRATPSWVAICMGLSILVYALLYWLTDVKNRISWTRWIEPAGYSTLTCYLVPYIYYAIWSIYRISLPEALRTGWIGLIKSLLFALLITAITGYLYRRKITLKV